MVFRDENFVVIDVGSLTTRAVVGLAESMTLPTIRVATKVGVRRTPEQSQPEYLFDQELEDAIQKKEADLEVKMPIVQGLIKDWEAIEIFW